MHEVSRNDALYDLYEALSIVDREVVRCCLYEGAASLEFSSLSMSLERLDAMCGQTGLPTTGKSVFTVGWKQLHHRQSVAGSEWLPLCQWPSQGLMAGS